MLLLCNVGASSLSKKDIVRANEAVKSTLVSTNMCLVLQLHVCTDPWNFCCSLVFRILWGSIYSYKLITMNHNFYFINFHHLLVFALACLLSIARAVTQDDYIMLQLHNETKSNSPNSFLEKFVT